MKSPINRSPPSSNFEEKRVEILGFALLTIVPSQHTLPSTKSLSRSTRTHRHHLTDLQLRRTTGVSFHCRRRSWPPHRCHAPLSSCRSCPGPTEVSPPRRVLAQGEVVVTIGARERELSFLWRPQLWRHSATPLRRLRLTAISLHRSSSERRPRLDSHLPLHKIKSGSSILTSTPQIRTWIQFRFHTVQVVHRLSCG
jgi:hypothetical protein